MPVTATQGLNTRQFTCPQWDAMPAGNNGWTLVSRNCGAEYSKKQKSPYASYDLGVAISTLVSRRTIKLVADDPGGIVEIEGKILLQTIVVVPATGSRTIGIGTTFGGLEVSGETITIASNAAFSFTNVQYYADPTFYFEVSDYTEIYIVFDKLEDTV